eukprot:6611652-Alexandrium_andersonii.AAC.1
MKSVKLTSQNPSLGSFCSVLSCKTRNLATRRSPEGFEGQVKSWCSAKCSIFSCKPPFRVSCHARCAV